MGHAVYAIFLMEFWGIVIQNYNRRIKSDAYF